MKMVLFMMISVWHLSRERMFFDDQEDISWCPQLKIWYALDNVLASYF